LPLTVNTVGIHALTLLFIRTTWRPARAARAQTRLRPHARNSDARSSSLSSLRAPRASEHVGGCPCNSPTRPLCAVFTATLAKPKLCDYSALADQVENRKLERSRRADSIPHWGKGIWAFVSDEDLGCPDEGSAETLRRPQASHFADFWLMLGKIARPAAVHHAVSACVITRWRSPQPPPAAGGW
jgi:hypothetical protein